jgi:hypothetical protein
MSCYHCRRELFFVSCFLFSLALLAVLCLDCCGFASRMRRANALCTLLRAADEPMPLAVDCSPNTKRRSLSVLCLRPRQTPLSVCWRCKFTLSSLPDCRRGGDACCVSTSKFVVSARAGATNDVATSEVARVLSASSAPRLLSYLALLAQRQNKRNESDRGMFDTRSTGTARDTKH